MYHNTIIMNHLPKTQKPNQVTLLPNSHKKDTIDQNDISGVKTNLKLLTSHISFTQHQEHQVVELTSTLLIIWAD